MFNTINIEVGRKTWFSKNFNKYLHECSDYFKYYDDFVWCKVSAVVLGLPA